MANVVNRISTGSSLAAAAAAAAAVAAQAASTPEGSTMTPQKTPFAIQELLGLTSADQVKNSAPSSGSGLGSNTMSGSNFPAISCYNNSFFNGAVDTYNQHQRMYFNSAGLFGNLHHQSQSFASASSAAAASHLLDSTLRSDHTLSSKQIFVYFYC